MTQKPFVIGLSGVPGSGKTTLSRLLVKHFSHAQTICYDQFHPGLKEDEIVEWVAKSGDPNKLPLLHLATELARRTQSGDKAQPRQPLILFETAFGRVHQRTGAFIDFLVWIDTPLDIALSRACQVFLNPAQRNKSVEAEADFFVWLSRYMRDYPMLHRMYSIVNAQMPPLADLRLDGMENPDVLFEIVKSALASRGITA